MTLPPPSPPSANSPSRTIVTVICLCCMMLRTVIGFHKHSGQGENHSGVASYGGDYEAQRHWMELTLHLPLKQWYTYDTDYWGLDYPPLTAYVSYLCGLISEKIFCGPVPTALLTSRGYDEDFHKAYMRATVLLLDVVIYFTAVLAIASALHHHPTNRNYYYYYYYWTIGLALTQPALILIDHGHFQYNSVALGLTLWSLYYAANNYYVAAAILFCLSLNFKQISLFYSPVVFAYLLGRCFQTNNNKGSLLFFTLAITVLLTFALLWAPFYYDSQSLAYIVQIVHRIFPFHRGLFENKVANLWCALSTKPLSIRKRIPQDLQPLLALLLTFLMILPPSIVLFLVGKRHQPTTLTQSPNIKLHLKFLLLGATTCSLAFFLAGFQVHEKSILFPLSPLSLLVLCDDDNDLFVHWFSMVAVWTLWPLMIVDKLQLAYSCWSIIYLVVVQSSRRMTYNIHYSRASNYATPTTTYILMKNLTNTFIIPVSAMVMILLHLLETIVTCPAHLPDLFTVLWSIGGCAMFFWSYLYCLAYLGEMYYHSNHAINPVVVAAGSSSIKKKQS